MRQLENILNYTIKSVSCRRYLKGTSWNRSDLKMTGKVVVITGANSGIGKATALDLAKRGATVYMACHDKSRGEAAQRDVIERTENTNVFYRQLDLASLDSVRNFADKFLGEQSQLDVLINNAGMVYPKYKESQDGFEMQMGVNHLGHFLLTILLTDLLKRSSPSRIINISSLAHKFGRIDKSDLMNKKKPYRAFGAYANTKLANVLFTRELSRHLLNTGVTVNAVHPGVVRTEIWKTPKTLSGKIQNLVMRSLFKDPMEGAQTMIRLAVDPELETVTGQYFV